MKKIILFLVISFGLGQTALGSTPNTIIGIVSDPQSTLNSPIDIAITPNGLKAYISNSLGNSISILDIASNTIIGTISNATDVQAPQGIAITPNGLLALVASSGNNQVNVINVASDTVTTNVNNPNFNAPLDIAITPDGSTAYVTNNGDNNVSIVNIASLTATGYIIDLSSVINSPSQIAISPTANKGYIVNSGSSNIVVFNTLTNSVTGLVTGSFTGVRNIVFSPDGSTAYAVGSAQLYIIDTTLDQTINTINLSGIGINLAISPDGSTVYIIENNNTIEIFDVATQSITGTVSDPQSTLNFPFAMAITPDGSTGYITNPRGNTISILFIKTPPPPQPTIRSPQTLIGCKTANIFLTQIDYINFLRWTAPSFGTSPIKYIIYRNSTLNDFVASIPANQPLQYFDHNRNPNVTYSYYIVSVDQSGNVSSPSIITVNSYCPFFVPI